LNCADCLEPIIESERRGMATCKGCNGPLHFECAMSAEDTEDRCEVCHEKASAAFRRAMALRGSQLD
jgi:hypothetical protein